MKKSFFSKSVEILIAIFLGLIAFLGNNAHSLLIGAFVTWLIINLFAYRKRIKNFFFKLNIKGKSQTSKKPVVKAKESLPATDAEPTNKRIVQLFSLLITERLKASYPEVTWRFVTNNYLNVAKSGGICRIGLNRAEGYSYAEINYDALGRLKVHLIKVDELHETDVIKLPQENLENEDIYCLNDWFKSVGNDALTNIVIKLNSNGYSKLYIEESGEILTDLSSDKEASKAGKLENFPTKAQWSDLIKLFDEIGLKIKQDKDNLVVTW